MFSPKAQGLGGSVLPARTLDPWSAWLTPLSVTPVPPRAPSRPGLSRPPMEEGNAPAEHPQTPSRLETGFHRCHRREPRDRLGPQSAAVVLMRKRRLTPSPRSARCVRAGAGWPSTCLLRAWSQWAPPRSAGRPGEGFTHTVGHSSSRMSPASPPGGGAFWPWEVKGRGLQEWLRLAPGPSPLPLPHESLGGDTAVPSPGSAGRGAAGCLSSWHQGPGVEPAHGCSPSEGNLWVGHVPGLALPREGPSLEAPQQGRGVGPPAPQLWAPYEEVNSHCLQEPPSHGLRASCAAGGLSMGLPITRKSVPSDQHPTPRRPAA